MHHQRPPARCAASGCAPPASTSSATRSRAGRDPEPLLRAALSGGVDIVQLREKSLPQPRDRARGAHLPPPLRHLQRPLHRQRRPRAGPRLRRRRRPRRPGRRVRRRGPRAARPGCDHRPLDPLRGAARGRRGGARRLHQRRPGLGDADQRGAPGRRPRARLARGPQRPPSLLRDRRDRPVERRPGRRSRRPPARGGAGDPRRRGAGGRRRSAARRRWPTSARRRRVAERRKRKDRPSAQERMKSGYAKAEVRNQEARESLEPLAEGERPMVVTVGAAISALIALSILVGYLSGVEVNGDEAAARPGPGAGPADGDHGLGHVARPLLGRARLPAGARLPDLRRRLRDRDPGLDRRPVRLLPRCCWRSPASSSSSWSRRWPGSRCRSASRPARGAGQSGAPASARRTTDGCRATFGPRIPANSVNASQGRR